MAGFAAIALLFGVTSWIVARPSRAGARAAAAAASSVDLAAGSGLRVLASPWAHVRVDGAQVETTPFARPIPLAAGKHWVQLVHPESPPVEREIEIGEGQVVTLDVTMPVGSLDGGAGRDHP